MIKKSITLLSADRMPHTLGNLANLKFAISQVSPTVVHAEGNETQWSRISLPPGAVVEVIV